MPQRFRYILLGLLFLIIYEVYLILLYTYRDFQTNSYMTDIQNRNSSITTDIQTKEQHLATIRTPAYADKITKLAQNKKDPGETVVFFISQNDNQKYTAQPDTIAQIQTQEYQTPPKTAGMTNPQKWMYYVFGVDTRGETQQ